MMGSYWTKLISLLMVGAIAWPLAAYAELPTGPVTLSPGAADKAATSKPVTDGSVGLNDDVDDEDAMPSGQPAQPIVRMPSNDPTQKLHYVLMDEEKAAFQKKLAEMDLLWRCTVERSPTLMLAMQKLADKAEGSKDKKRQSIASGLLPQLVQLGGIGASATMGTAFPMIGSAFLTGLSGSGAAAAAMKHVTATDLVLLARQIDSTQVRLVERYMAYDQAKKRQESCKASLDHLQNQSAQWPHTHREMNETLRTLVIHQTHQCQQAQDEVVSTRQLLVLMTGKDAVAAVDQGLVLRAPVDNSDKPQVPALQSQVQSKHRKKSRDNKAPREETP